MRSLDSSATLSKSAYILQNFRHLTATRPSRSHSPWMQYTGSIFSLACNPKHYSTFQSQPSQRTQSIQNASSTKFLDYQPRSHTRIPHKPRLRLPRDSRYPQSQNTHSRPRKRLRTIRQNLRDRRPPDFYHAFSRTYGLNLVDRWICRQFEED